MRGRGKLYFFFCKECFCDRISNKRVFGKGEFQMANNVAIGIQDFLKLREQNCFYIDKTSFIKEWWEKKDEVTLITRPRRFGKTLNMSMVEQF